MYFPTSIIEQFQRQSVGAVSLAHNCGPFSYPRLAITTRSQPRQLAAGHDEFLGNGLGMMGWSGDER